MAEIEAVADLPKALCPSAAGEEASAGPRQCPVDVSGDIVVALAPLAHRRV